MEFSFPTRLKVTREQKGLSQLQLAEQLGKRSAAVSKYENGDAYPNLETLFEICKILNVSADYLLGLSETVCTSESSSAESLFQQIPANMQPQVLAYLEGVLFGVKSASFH